MIKNIFSVALFILTIAVVGDGWAGNNTATIDDTGLNNDNDIGQKGDDNEAEIEQTSDDNEAEIEQGGKKVPSDDNQAVIEQGHSGGGDFGFIDQKGDFSKAAIIQVLSAGGFSGETDDGNNKATIKQGNSTSITSPNEALILQVGSYNNTGDPAHIEQNNGLGNMASIVQTGDYSQGAEIYQKGGGNQAAIFQLADPYDGNSTASARHSAEIEQGKSGVTTTTSKAVIWQQGGGYVSDAFISHEATISQRGLVNKAGAAQTQSFVNDEASIKQEGTGNSAISIQGLEPEDFTVDEFGFDPDGFPIINPELGPIAPDAFLDF